MARTKRQLHITRLFALALCLLLACSALPGRAYALSGTTGGLNWSLSAGTLTITGSGTMPNYTDANMAPWYDSATAINRIVVGEGVTSVGSLAFYGCSTALRASLPSTVQSIGDRAFKNCTALTWVNLPEGLERIGEATFENCIALNGIVLPNSLRSIGNYAFERCTSLTSIVIPAGVTDLGMVVFYHCTALTRATIRCPIDKLPDWFFYGCTALTTLELPATVTETGDKVFQNCEKLSEVYCSGSTAETVSETLRSDTATRYAEVIDSGENPALSASNTTYDTETDTSTTVTVTQSVQAVVTQTTQTSYTYTVDGQVVTDEEAFAAAESGKVEIEKQASSAVTATVTGSDGWKEVAQAAETAVRSHTDSKPVSVTVQLTSSTVNGGDLSNMAGVDTKLTVATPEGCVWAVDTAKQNTNSFGNKEIDLSYTVELTDSTIKGIESSTVYQVEFASNVSTAVTVGVPIKVSNARQTATIYEKGIFRTTEVSSAVVDESGYAWLPVSEISKNKDYYVAINAGGVDTSNAVIPDSMLESYGVNYEQTLTDAAGKQYEVGARESRWGITGKQFTIYAVIAVAAIVLIVTGVMITLNKISKSKTKYAAMAAEDDCEFDEEELRLQIMQEMLEEVQREKNGE